MTYFQSIVEVVIPAKRFLVILCIVAATVDSGAPHFHHYKNVEFYDRSSEWIDFHFIDALDFRLS